MNTAEAVLVAITFTWLGLVLAISFLEAPLKFRAPNVTLPIGLGIGRLVFRALNTVEFVFAIIVVAAVAIGRPGSCVTGIFVVAVVALLIQLVAVRPRLNRRSDRVLAGDIAPRSNAHFVYVGLELIKVISLLVAGILLL
jgi:hypothetical protein